MEVTDDTLLTRGQLAQKLGVSFQEVNRRLRVGALKPYLKRGKEPIFHVGQLEEQRMLSRKRTVEPGREAVVDFTGKDAATVFKALREGKALDDIVIEHGVHPLIVKAASEAYAQLRGSLFVSAERMRELEKMPIDGEWPIQNDVQLIEMLRGALEESSCEKCKRKTRKVCLACAKSLARKGKHAASDDVVEDD